MPGVPRHPAARVAVIAAIASVAVTLTGCTPPGVEQVGTPEPAPVRTARPTPSAIPDPIPIAAPQPPATDVDLEEVAGIVVRPEHLDLVDGDGAPLTTLSYDLDAVSFVDALSAVLGGDPKVEERPGGHEWSPSTAYTWPGMQVVDDHEQGDYQADMNVAVQFTHPIIGDGVTVSTINGFRPGDSLRSFADELDERWNADGPNEFPAETGPEIGPRAGDFDTNTEWTYLNANAVSVNSFGQQLNPEATSSILAPWNFGIGHV